MFRPGAPLHEIERDVEAVVCELAAELDDRARRDPHPQGSGDRAYIRAFSDVRANSGSDQVGLLATAVTRPQLAESLIYLNRNLDREDLAPHTPAGLIGIIVRLAMDGLWASDILDATRFSRQERDRIIEVLTRLTYLEDGRLTQLLAELTPEGRDGPG